MRGPLDEIPAVDSALEQLPSQFRQRGDSLVSLQVVGHFGNPPPAG
jgi:hypothetical protein